MEGEELELNLRLREDGLDQFHGIVSLKEFDSLYSDRRVQSPEQLLVRKQTYEALSKESRDVLKLLFDTPRTLGIVLAFKRNRAYSEGLTQSDLRSYLRAKGWNFVSIRKCFKELTKYVRNISNISENVL